MHYVISIYLLVLFTTIRNTMYADDDKDAIITIRPIKEPEYSRYSIAKDKRLELGVYLCYLMEQVLKPLFKAGKYLNIILSTIESEKKQTKFSDKPTYVIYEKIKKYCFNGRASHLEEFYNDLVNMFESKAFVSAMENIGAQLSLSKQHLSMILYHSRKLQFMLLQAIDGSTLEPKCKKIYNVCGQDIFFEDHILPLLNRITSLMKKRENTVCLCDEGIYKETCEIILKYTKVFPGFLKKHKVIFSRMFRLMTYRGEDRQFFECVGYEVIKYGSTDDDITSGRRPTGRLTGDKEDEKYEPGSKVLEFLQLLWHMNKEFFIWSMVFVGIAWFLGFLTNATSGERNDEFNK